MRVSHLPDEAIIDQRDETFIPLVSLIRAAARVVFTNHDTTMHQVYSFSPIKQFAFEIDQGQRSQPVVFDKPGVSSIGCNIHDQMMTFVYVADSPWAAITDAKGHARHRQRARRRLSREHLASAIDAGPPAAGGSHVGRRRRHAKLSRCALAAARPMPGMKHMHMQMY